MPSLARATEDFVIQYHFYRFQDIFLVVDDQDFHVFHGSFIQIGCFNGPAANTTSLTRVELRSSQQAVTGGAAKRVPVAFDVLLPLQVPL